ncbi:MAG: hypothetical protein K0R80_114 [Clostridia bacterium]|nr:hypothetical protein [Clostridia bacterium]
MLHEIPCGVLQIKRNGVIIFQNIPVGISDMEQYTSTNTTDSDVKLNQEVFDNNERQRNQEGK